MRNKKEPFFDESKNQMMRIFCWWRITNKKQENGTSR